VEERIGSALRIWPRVYANSSVLSRRRNPDDISETFQRWIQHSGRSSEYVPLDSDSRCSMPMLLSSSLRFPPRTMTTQQGLSRQANTRPVGSFKVVEQSSHWRTELKPPLTMERRS